jgi:DNA polymerase-3 subunit alpha
VTTSNFVGLHVHSEGSFLDGFSGVQAIAKRTNKLGQGAVGITDHGECNQHLAFAKACAAEGIKPLFGMEGYLVDSVDRVRAEKDSKNSHITLIAKDQQGLSNLWAWATEASVDLSYYKPLMDWEHGKRWAEGLYATDGCLLSYLARAVIEDDEDRCHHLLGEYLNLFGDNFRIELHTWQFEQAVTDEQRELNEQMTKVNQAKVSLAQQYGIPLLVVNDAHYSEEYEWENHALVWEMQTKDKSDQTKSRGKTAAHQMGDEELVYWMGRHGISREITEEAIKNTYELANSCTAEIQTKLRMPRLTASDEEDAKMFIEHLEDGFQRKVIDKGKDPGIYRPRMQYEADMILGKIFGGYLNMVANYTKYAKTDMNMLVGPARGSGSGSLCAYLSDITEVDPIYYDLPFERFMTPGRKNFPDIDIDFPQSRRPEMKQELVRRFGEDKVASIGTLTRLGPAGILDNLYKAMNLSYMDKKEMAEIFETSTVDVDTTKAGEAWPLFLDELKDKLDPWMKKYPLLFQRMGEMVGMVRQSSTHASGILISNEPLLGIMPLRKKKGTICTMFDMNEVEWLGFIKFDILGIRHLDTIEQTCRFIGMNPHDLYDFGEKEFSDPEIWTEVCAGDTLGIFQLETAQLTRATKRFQPKSEIDVTDLISVNRPGVIDAKQLDPFLDRRAGLEAPHYDNPLTEKHLGRTYGILVFQEQILRIVQDIAGFSPDDADSVRSAVGKKKMEKLQAFHEPFIEGCLNNPEFVQQSESGDPAADAEKIWNSIGAAGRYAFSLNHATAYAIISSWEVWLKHYHYHAYITALMATDSERVPVYMRHARQRGYEVLPPDINESQANFSMAPNAVRCGLVNIAKIADATAQLILPYQPFESFEDYLERTKANRGVTMNLIRIGAFDRFGEDRSTLYRRYIEFLATKSKVKKDRIKFQEMLDAGLPDLTDPDVIYETEMELVGSFITQDPMGKYVNMIEKVCVQLPQELDDLAVGELATVGGQITRRKDIVTKKGDPMCFLTIEWNFYEFEVVVFPKAFATNKVFLDLDAPVACRVIKLDKGVHMTECVRLDYLD